MSPKAARIQFTHTPLQRQREPHPLQYLKEKTSFWIAVLSLFTFVAGNMLGSHGWYAFWASVIGSYDDSLITYTGTVAPIEFVPDYTHWGEYGGKVDIHTFRQVPRDLLVALPSYDVREQRLSYELSSDQDVYSIGHMGSYATGAEGQGSHPGVDIRVPEGTPIRAIANGVVTQVRDSTGFGNIVVIRHPHMPDPSDPKKETVLYSVYAHLSSQFVSRGQIVEKGEVIALSGRSGNVTGPHLHFQVDRDDAPWHPYWPFSGTEAEAAGLDFTEAINRAFNQDRGYQYTIHPMLYVQSNYPRVIDHPTSAIARANGKGSDIQPIGVLMEQKVAGISSEEGRIQKVSRILSKREQRLRERASRALSVARRVSDVSPSQTLVVKEETIVRADSEIDAENPLPVSTLSLHHDGTFAGRGWEQIEVTVLDEHGQRIQHPNLGYDLVMRTAYGDAEFRPERLSAKDFQNGTAIVQMLPRGQRTIVIQVMPLNVLSDPMKYVP